MELKTDIVFALKAILFVVADFSQGHNIFAQRLQGTLNQLYEEWFL